MSENKNANLISAEALELVMSKVKEIVDPIIRDNARMQERIEILEEQVEALDNRLNEFID